MTYAQKRQSMLRRLAETPYSGIRERIERNLAELKPPAPRRVVIEWSEACACGGNFLGHEEEPCRPDCTGYYPVRWGSRQQSGEAMCRTCRFMNRWLHLCDQTRWSRESCACREDHSLERFKV